MDCCLPFSVLPLRCEDEKKNARVLHGNDFCALALHFMQQVMCDFNINSETYKDMRGKILCHLCHECVFIYISVKR